MRDFHYARPKNTSQDQHSDTDNAHTVGIIGQDKNVLGHPGYTCSVFHLDLDFMNMALKQFCLILGKSLFKYNSFGNM